MIERVDVAVVGAGVAGLGAAYAAERGGASVVVLEAASRAGGVISTERTGGFLVEHGPTSMTSSPPVLALLREIGLEKEIVNPPAVAGRRFIVRDGVLHTLPQSPPALLRSRLLSQRGKLRALAEPLIARASGTGPEESLAALVTRRFGKEVLDYVVDPFVSGVYAGNPDTLSSRHAMRILGQLEQQHGSVLVGAMKGARHRGSAPHIMSFRNGMQALPTALAGALRQPPVTGTAVTLVEAVAGGWRLGCRGGLQMEAQQVVVAVPSHRLAGIDWPLQLRPPLHALTRVGYAPVCTVALGFDQPSVGHALNGFGALVPAMERSRILGVLFNSTMFTNRAPDANVLLTCFVGGARSSRAPTRNEAEGWALEALGPLLGLTGAPAMVSTACWEQGIPQFTIGYDAILEAITAAEQLAPGLSLTGSYRSGVAIGECLVQGLSCGEAAAAAALRAKHQPIQRA